MKLPNYEHRIFPAGTTDDFTLTDLGDVVGQSVEQVDALILQMQSQYIHEDSEKTPDGVNFSVLEVIRKELLDINVLVNWFREKETEGGEHEL